jgi:hypothetical protein
LEWHNLNAAGRDALSSTISVKHVKSRTLVGAVILLLSVGLFLIHAPVAQASCHEMQHWNQSDICPCGVISLNALVLMSRPFFQGSVFVPTSQSAYLVFLGKPDPPPRPALFV